MLSKTELIRAYNKGQLEEVTKECLRYGDIKRDVQWDTPDGYHKGAHRVRDIRWLGIDWNIHMWNGEVRSVGHNYVPQKQH